jgi:hypothetical protein
MPDSRVHCNFCHRHIAVNPGTGFLGPHRTKGRQGRYCSGADKLPEARPVAGAA